MKRIIILAALLFHYSMAAKAQETSFHISGKLSGEVKDSVVISYPGPQKKRIILAVPIEHGVFEAAGTISYPVAASIYFKNKNETLSREQVSDRAVRIYLEPLKMQLTGDPSQPASIKLKGSQTQQDNEALTKLTDPIEQEMKPLSDLYAKEKDHDKAAVIMVRFAPYTKRIKAATYQFFLDHPHSFVTSDRLMFYVSSLSLDSIKRVYDAMTAVQKSTPGGAYVTNALEKLAAGLPGKIAASFTSTDITNKSLSLNDFKGKYVLLDFWASWCVPCRKGNPHLKELFLKYQSKGFDIVGIAADDAQPVSWKKAIEKDGIALWHHILAGQASPSLPPSAKDINEKYGIHTLPTKILIDPQGNIIGRYGDSIGESEEKLDEKLRTIYQQ